MPQIIYSAFMKRHSAIIFAILLAGLHVYGQASSCHCLANLDTIINKTELNYAGYPAKTSGEKSARYKALVKSLRQRATGISSPLKCFDVLKDYVSYFKDRHFDLSYQLDSSNRKFSTLTEKDVKNVLQKNDAAAIEGIWINPDSTIKIAIRQSARDSYEGIVLESSDKQVPVGLIYLTLHLAPHGYTFLKYNYLTLNFPARHEGGLLRLWNMELWGKVYPDQMSQPERSELAIWKDHNSGFAFRQLDEKTAYLKLPTFGRDDLVQKLVAKNDSAIRHSPYLIVDLRGNGGGNTGWAYLLPYFMTRPIEQGTMYLRLSDDNSRRMLKEMELFIKNPIPSGAEKYYTPAFMAKYRKAYQEIPDAQAEFYPIPTISIPVDEMPANPHKIALVFDDLCGSSTEYFFHVSRQSDKIRRYGIPTLGMMDYIGMHHLTPLPFKDYHLVIPDTKSSWTDEAPIDATGFKPEYDLHNISPKEWIEHIQKDLMMR
jgi:hypothetical protein